MIGRYDSFAFLNADNELTYCSEPFAVLLGAPRNALAGTRIETLVAPLDCDRAASWLAPGSPGEGLLCGPGPSRFWYRLERVQGPPHAGAVLYIESDEQHPEGPLKELYPFAFHLNPGLSAISTARSGVHLDVNTAWLHALGYSRAEVIGKSAAELRVWDNDAVRTKIIHHLRENGEIDNFEARLRTKHDSYLDVIVSAELITHRGEELCFFASLDVTRIKRARRQQASLQKRIVHLKKKSMLDPLTSVANRRCLDSTLTRDWNTCRRHGTPLSLLFIDVDFFKQYNDHYGHQAGDEALCAVAQAMGKILRRPGDVLCRYGGEEFCCLLPDTDYQGAWDMARQLQTAVQDLALPHEKSPVAPHLTISIGLATAIPNLANRIDQLVRLADHNLYKAKESGRARIEGSVPLEGAPSCGCRED